MRRALSFLLLTAGAMAGALAAPAAPAQDTPVYRCVGANGEPVFSGQPCSALRLPSGSASAAAAETPAAPQNHGFCAADAEELRERAAAAIDAHDANRLAALFLWQGMDGAAALARLHELAAIVDGPVLGLQLEGATSAPAASAAAPSDGSAAALLVRRAIDPWNAVAAEEARYPLVQRDGCWWLRF
ncbi:hypothetical protein MBSD_n0377 [Mizugakiibacter sediminis]|uniref:DUF4124 domain-containing protein n=1 Tax=Mizugakiibacter sediminis TaxID=1475481 RepID=A0A0K8QJP3_9GAMM|nr:hypothetical protein [Mizugakiibacter sediminis]GAP65088.1 hypothetical protein MBSD_n0377 [Mizugakiibacter sediminis]